MKATTGTKRITKTSDFMTFWEILLFSGRDIRYGEARDLFKDYQDGFKVV